MCAALDQEPEWRPPAQGRPRRISVQVCTTYSRTSPGGANRALDTLSRIMNHALVCGHVATNPARGVKRNPTRQMTRFLSRDEIRLLHETMDACVAERPSRGPRADIVRLLLLTGCRSGEIRSLQWREVGEDVLALSDSMTGPRTVYLNRDATR